MVTLELDDVLDNIATNARHAAHAEIASVYHFPRLAAVVILGLLGRYAPPAFQHRAIELMMKIEKLAKLPTRFVTGYFVAALATKRQ